MTLEELTKEIRKMINASYKETDELVQIRNEYVESMTYEPPVRREFDKKHNQLIGYQAALLSVLELIPSVPVKR